MDIYAQYTPYLQYFPVVGFPHNNRIVARATNYYIAVGAERETAHPVGVSGEGFGAVAGGDFPALQRAIAGAREQHVRPEGHGRDRVVVAPQRLYASKRTHIPYLGAHIRRRRGQHIPGGAEC